MVKKHKAFTKMKLVCSSDMNIDAFFPLLLFPSSFSYFFFLYHAKDRCNSYFSFSGRHQMVNRVLQKLNSEENRWILFPRSV